MQGKYEAIIFDCDGVLVDSEVISASVWVEILSLHGVEKSIATILEDFQGGNIHTSLNYIIDHIGPIDKIELENLYRSMVKTKFQQSLRAIDGVKDFLLKSDLKRCIASNGPFDKIIENLKITDLSSFFDNEMIFSGQTLNMYKPAPDLFLYAAKQIGTDLSKCVVIEDSKNGVLAAQASGIDVVYYNPHHSNINLIPTAMYDSMQEIYNFIHF